MVEGLCLTKNTRTDMVRDFRAGKIIDVDYRKPLMKYKDLPCFPGPSHFPPNENINFCLSKIKTKV